MPATEKIAPFTLDLGNGENVTITELAHDGEDLDTDPITLSDGTVLDNAGAERLSQEIVSRAETRRGRPSLSGAPEKSPHIGIRVSADVRDRLMARAEREGKTLSELAREALTAYAS